MVKCSECGFLTLREAFTGQLDEVDADFRKTGNPPRRRSVKQIRGIAISAERTPYIHIPICFANATNFRNEIGELPKGYAEYTAALVLPEIVKERQCSEFMEWQQGFTPKEHREMLDRKEFRDWQSRQEKERLKERRWDALLLVLVAGGFTILGAVLGALLR